MITTDAPRVSHDLPVSLPPTIPLCTLDRYLESKLLSPTRPPHRRPAGPPGANNHPEGKNKKPDTRNCAIELSRASNSGGICERVRSIDTLPAKDKRSIPRPFAGPRICRGGFAWDSRRTMCGAGRNKWSTCSHLHSTAIDTGNARYPRAEGRGWIPGARLSGRQASFRATCETIGRAKRKQPGSGGRERIHMSGHPTPVSVVRVWDNQSTRYPACSDLDVDT